MSVYRDETRNVSHQLRDEQNERERIKLSLIPLYNAICEAYKVYEQTESVSGKIENTVLQIGADLERAMAELRSITQ